MKPYYEHAGIMIFLADCRDLLGDLSADVLVTDPPYGVNYSSGWENKFCEVKICGDEDLACRDQVLKLWGDRPALVFGSWKMPRPADTKAVLIWDKGTVGMGDLRLPWFPCTEEIYVLGYGWSGTRTSAVMRHVNRNFHHPTEKPVELMSDLIRKCEPGAIVIDPFCGSGTTLVAAKELGHSAIGVEIHEPYAEIAAKRLSQEVFAF